MKKTIKAFVLAAGLGAASIASAASSIGVVDVQSLFRQSPQIKKIDANLTQQFAARKAKISKAQASLQSQMQSFEKNKSVMSASKSAAMEKQINTQSASLSQQEMAFKQDVYTAQNKAMGDFMKTVEASIAKIAKSDNLTLVVAKNTVLYSQDNNDITAAVAKDLNA